MFLVAVIRNCGKNVRERGSVSSHSSRGQSAVVGRSWWQEFEAAGHTVSTVRKQRGLSFVPSFFFSPGNGASYSGQTLLPQSNQDNPPHGPSTWVIPDLTMLTTEIFHDSL